MGSEAEGGGRSPVQVVLDVLAAITDGRAQDLAALVHPQVEWRTAARPAKSVYYGRAEMSRYLSDLRAAFGRIRLDIDDIAGDGAQVTVRLHVAQQDGDVPSTPVAGVFTVRGGLVTKMDSLPDASLAPRPPR